MSHFTGYQPLNEFNQNAILKKFAILEANSLVWSSLQRSIVEVTQTDALAADPDAQSLLVANRAFIKNNDVVPRVINFNGFPFTFLAATTYCPSPDEATILLQRASELGFNITVATLADFIATGVVETFFE